jgi:hypothetical protein
MLASRKIFILGLSLRLFGEKFRDRFVVFLLELLKLFFGIEFDRKSHCRPNEDSLGSFLQGNQTTVSQIKFFPHFLGKAIAPLGPGSSVVIVNSNLWRI